VVDNNVEVESEISSENSVILNIDYRDNQILV